jgi:hypothetical protein
VDPVPDPPFFLCCRESNPGLRICSQELLTTRPQRRSENIKTVPKLCRSSQKWLVSFRLEFFETETLKWKYSKRLLPVYTEERHNVYSSSHRLVIESVHSGDV